MKRQQVDCEQVLRRLFDFLDGEVGARERSAMQHHLSLCRSCFSRMEFEQRLKERVRELRTQEEDAGARERMRRLIETF